MYLLKHRLFAVPLNLKFKYFPFAKKYSSSFNKFYFGVGGGAMYVNEEITSQIFLDDTQLTYLGAKSFKILWTSDYEISAGFSSFSKIGYGFELSYRFVPLNNSTNVPLITSIASNFNSVNFTANIVFKYLKLIFQ